VSRRLPALLVAAALLVTACSGDDDDPAASTTTPTPAPAAGETTTTGDPAVEATLDRVELATQEIAELTSPVAFAARPSSPDIYIAEKGGTVRLVRVTTSEGGSRPRYQLQNTPVLDLSDEVIDQGEQGLLGLAFSSDGRDLYVNFTAEPDGRTLVLQYALGDRSTVDLDSRRQLLEVEQPAENHNGGHLVVGPDGYLYVGLGDGGGAGDPDGNGQDPDTLLGSILRIDPEGATDDRPYAIPAGNPFADGAEGAPEVWLYGVRNPWRFSFDSVTGDLWVADVGQGEWEEITRLPASAGFDAGRGANLGWDRMEGTHQFEGPNPAGAVLPLHEYSHEDGSCSITGGFQYRGTAMAELRGSYLFADYCTPGVRAIQLDVNTVIAERTWDVVGEGVASFGEDQDGEVFVLLDSGPVLKLVPAGEDD
jgi:glucose/arabinose dehydrogenase